MKLSNHSTQISQNADDISFYADEIEKLKITKDKIILNGDIGFEAAQPDSVIKGVKLGLYVCHKSGC